VKAEPKPAAAAPGGVQPSERCKRPADWWADHVRGLVLGMLDERGVETAWLNMDQVAEALDASLPAGFPNPRGIRHLIGQCIRRLGIAQGPGERWRESVRRPDGTRYRRWAYLVRKADLVNDVERMSGSEGGA